MVGEEQKFPTLCKMASEEASVFDREEEVVWYLSVSFLFPSPCSSDLNGLLVCVDYELSGLNMEWNGLNMDVALTKLAVVT